MNPLEMDRVLETCVRHGAADVWMIPGRPPMLHTGGELLELDIAPLSSADVLRLVSSIALPTAREGLEREGRATFEYEYRDPDSFRVYVFRHDGTDVAILARKDARDNLEES